jgi:phthalate 4,5-dioxygenase
MLSLQDNELLTRTGLGTPMGALFRRFWHPVLLTEELPEADGTPVRLRVLGENLVAFRDTQGRVGIVDALCPHRRAGMFFGRNEECGLRCVYHGWKFDVHGNCVDMPTEPATSNFKGKVKIKAYLTAEYGGCI